MNSTPGGHAARRSRAPIIAVVLVALAVLAVAVAVALGSGDTPPTGLPASPSPSTAAPGTPTGTGPSGSPSATASALPAPSQSGRPPSASAAPDATATLADDVTVRLSGVESIQGTADLPGDIAGPALRVEVEVTNDSDALIPLSGTVVNAYYGATQTPATQLSGSGAVAFPASLAAGESVTARFVYTIPTGERDDVAVEVDLSALGRPVVFRGSFG